MEENIKITTDDRKIGDNHSVFTIAELSVNHLQKFELAVETIKSIKEAGADSIKLRSKHYDIMV
jgi:sialic acid synthase SpsE